MDHQPSISGAKLEAVAVPGPLGLQTEYVRR